MLEVQTPKFLQLMADLRTAERTRSPDLADAAHSALIDYLNCWATDQVTTTEPTHEYGAAYEVISLATVDTSRSPAELLQHLARVRARAYGAGILDATRAHGYGPTTKALLALRAAYAGDTAPLLAYIEQERLLAYARGASMPVTEGSA